MKDNKLKRNTFMQGAFIATFGIVLSKILGMIYVIPFYSIIGEQGGALYGYAYNIYSIFLSISTAGIALAISTITSEYNTLKMNKTKDRAFFIAKRFLNVLGITCFLVLFIFSKEIAYLIIGDITGGNSIEDITFVIRTIALSILIVPMLSVYRGYFQGHKFITPTSISQVIEQLVRVVIIILGSFIAAKVLKLPIKYAVMVALLGATIGAIVSLLYLVIKKQKNKELFDNNLNVDEQEIKNFEILKKILLCAFPFILCDLFKSLYNSVDTFFVVKTLVNLDYSVVDAESVMSVISTWGNKLNMIVVAIGTGFSTSLIPNLTTSLVKKDRDDINLKVNQTLSSLVFITLPMTVGLSFLSFPVWNIFYGISNYGDIVFKFSIFAAFFNVILSSSMVIALTLKEYKTLILALFAGLVFNACFDVPAMHLLNNIGLAHYGATLSTILGFIITISIILMMLVKKYKLNLKNTFKNSCLSVCLSVLMLAILYLLSKVFIITDTRKIVSIIIVAVYAVVGGLVYLLTSYKFGLINSIFGEDRVTAIKNKIFRKKR